MNIIKKFFKNIIKQPDVIQQEIGGYDLDDGVDNTKPEEYLEVKKVVKVDPVKADSEVEKKPGRPKGSSAKKVPAKKTPSKKIS